jgi:hypothetical protein
VIFRQKSSKIDHFGFGPDSLSFTVTQIQLLPVWGNFVIFRQKVSKMDHFSFVISGDLRVFNLLTQAVTRWLLIT